MVWARFWGVWREVLGVLVLLCVFGAWLHVEMGSGFRGVLGVK